MPRPPRKAAAAVESAPPKTRRSRRGSAHVQEPDIDQAALLAQIPFPTVLPLLPIRDQVRFPHTIFPLLVGREKSVRALEEAAAQHRYIFVVTQSNLQAEDPDPEELYTIGIAAEIMQVLRV